MVEILISLPPSGRDMRDGLITLPSLGQAAGVLTTRFRSVTFRNVVDVFIILRISLPVKLLEITFSCLRSWPSLLSRYRYFVLRWRTSPSCSWVCPSSCISWNASLNIYATTYAVNASPEQRSIITLHTGELISGSIYVK